MRHLIITNQYSRAKRQFPNAWKIVTEPDQLRGFHPEDGDKIQLWGDDTMGYPDGLEDEYKRLIREKRIGRPEQIAPVAQLVCRECRRDFPSLSNDVPYCSDCESLFEHGYCPACGQIYGSSNHAMVHPAGRHSDSDVQGLVAVTYSIPAPPEVTLDRPEVDLTQTRNVTNRETGGNIEVTETTSANQPGAGAALDLNAAIAAEPSPDEAAKNRIVLPDQS